MKGKTMIRKCENPGCKHPFQDKAYNGKRVLNPMKRGDKEAQKYRCTICGREQH